MLVKYEYHLIVILSPRLSLEDAYTLRIVSGRIPKREFWVSLFPRSYIQTDLGPGAHPYSQNLYRDLGRPGSCGRGVVAAVPSAVETPLLTSGGSPLLSERGVGRTLPTHAQAKCEAGGD